MIVSLGRGYKIAQTRAAPSDVIDNAGDGIAGQSSLEPIVSYLGSSPGSKQVTVGTQSKFQFLILSAP